MLEKIGKYEVSEQIGVGGFGAVYRGRDPFIKRTVAIKTCQVNDEEIKHRFFREAELAGNLHHRNITTIYDFGVENGIPYIVQEFLTGEDLDKKIKRGDPIPVVRKIEILMAIAEGLGYAHGASIIHRDVKPANVRILEDGTVKVMDFGIAKSLQTESNLTQTGITLGTSAYLAPEQIRGEAIDRRTDVFALGVLSYELLAYRKPFRGEHLSTILYKILNENPEPVETIAPDVPPALVAVVNRALAKSPADRYATMEELRRDLQVVHRELSGQSGRYPVTHVLPDTVRAIRPEAADEDRTLATPSSGVAKAHITPPSGALARVPARDATPTSAPLPGGARPPLELVNFRDPTAEPAREETAAQQLPAEQEPRFTTETTGAVRRTRSDDPRGAPDPRRRGSGGLPPASPRARPGQARTRAARGHARSGGAGRSRVPGPEARRGRGRKGGSGTADGGAGSRGHARSGSGTGRREAGVPAEIQDTVFLGAGRHPVGRREGGGTVHSGPYAPTRGGRAFGPFRREGLRLPREDLPGRPEIRGPDPLPVSALDAGHRCAAVERRERPRRRQVPGNPSRGRAPASRPRDLHGHALSRRHESGHRKDLRGRGRFEELGSPGAFRRRGRLMRRALVVASALLFAALAVAQDAARLETEAKRAFDSGRFKEAGEKYAKAAESPGVPADRKGDLHLRSAWSYYIAGSSKSAREELKAALAARPDLQVIPDFYSPDFSNLAATVRAEVAGSSAPRIDIDELKRSARAKLADGKAEDALFDLKRAADSTDPEVFRLVAEADDRLGRAADADAARRRAAELEKGLVSSVPIGAPAQEGMPSAPVPPGAPAPPAAAAPLLESADRALREGDFRAAASFARQASEADPKNADAHRILGDAALALGQNADAEREFTAAIVLESASAKAELGLGVVAERQKKWNTAASHYRRALELDPKSVAAARGLGRAMSEIGDKSAARIAFGRSIEIDPASADARNDFGVFLFRSDEFDRSIEELMEAVRLDGSSALYHENLGRAFRKKAMWKEAERELAETARLSPNETAVWTALGQVRATEKRLDEAASAFATALALDPLDEEAAAGLGATLRAEGKLRRGGGGPAQGRREQHEVARPVEQPGCRPRRSGRLPPGDPGLPESARHRRKLRGRPDEPRPRERARDPRKGRFVVVG